MVTSGSIRRAGGKRPGAIAAGPEALNRCARRREGYTSRGWKLSPGKERPFHARLRHWTTTIFTMRGAASSMERRDFCDIARESYDFTSSSLDVTPFHFTSSDHAKIPSFLAICELDMQEKEKTVPVRGAAKETRHQGGTLWVNRTVGSVRRTPREDRCVSHSIAQGIRSTPWNTPLP